MPPASTRLSAESRYRRFFTSKTTLSAAELDYLVDVDHTNHEAIIAIDPASGHGLGVARYVRLERRCGTRRGRGHRRRRLAGPRLGPCAAPALDVSRATQGVRRFSALVQAENRASLGLLERVGDTRRAFAAGEVDLLIDLPREPGIGTRLARALRAAAAGSLVPARRAVRPGLPLHTIVVGTDGSETAANALAAAVGLASALGAKATS